MKKLLVKNSIFGIVQILINTCLILVVIPIFISILGTELYGVFSLVLVVGNLNTFANLGFQYTLIKYIAEKGICEDSSNHILTNICLLLVTITPLTIIAFIFNNFILADLLSVDELYMKDAKWLFFSVLTANFFLFLGQSFKAVLESRQKIYLTSLLQMVYNFLYWGLILFFILLDYELMGVGLGLIISSIIWFLLSLYFMKVEWGVLTTNSFRGNFKQNALIQIRYGSKIYAAGVLGFFYEPFTKILISNFIGINEVGYFDIIMKLRRQVYILVSKLFYPLFPFISAENNIERIKKYINNIEQKSFLIIIPMVIGCIFLIKPFVAIWIGENIDLISLSSIVIISGHLLFSVTVLPNYQFLIAKGYADKTVIIQFSNVVFNTIIFLLLKDFFGFYTVIVANVTSIAFSFILSLYYQNKYLESLIFDSFKQIVKLFQVLIINIAILFILSSLGLSNYSKLFIFPIIILTISIFAYRYLKLLSNEDIDLFFGFIPKANLFLKKIFIKN